MLSTLKYISKSQLLNFCHELTYMSTENGQLMILQSLTVSTHVQQYIVYYCDIVVTYCTTHVQQYIVYYCDIVVTYCTIHINVHIPTTTVSTVQYQQYSCCGQYVLMLISTMKPLVICFFAICITQNLLNDTTLVDHVFCLALNGDCLEFLYQS